MKNKKDVDNVKEFIWKLISTDAALKKDLSRGFINTRGLAKYILTTQKIEASLDSIISAIRRYPINQKEDYSSAYSILKQARINTRTKMASLLLKRTDDVKTILGRPDKLIDYQLHDIIRIIEGKEALTIIFDQKNYDKIVQLFPNKTILRKHKKIGLMEINYPLDLERTPGVFNIISSELAENNISIIDAVISSNEHIIVVDESNLLKAFEIVYELSK
ncbi:hypothetical protein H6503_03420 [Candidatus Woesearchaeota archaeon]|nr:hypothetical protein [Candidatus Woesearchaeota archaeon]